MRKFLIPLLLLWPVVLLAQSETLAPGMRIGPEIPIAPPAFGGVSDTPMAIVPDGSGFAAFTFHNNGITFTPVDAEGHPDVEGRKNIANGPTAVASSGGRPLIFWSDRGETYASRLATDGTLIGSEHVATGTPRIATCDQSKCVLAFIDSRRANFAIVTDREGRSITSPVAIPNTTTVSQVLVDPDGFAVVAFAVTGSRAGLSLFRYDAAGTLLFSVLLPPSTVTAVWANGAYKLLWYSFDTTSRILLETDVTTDGRLSEARGIFAQPGASQIWAMAVVPYGNQFLLVTEETTAPAHVEFVRYVLDASLTSVITNSPIATARMGASMVVGSNGSIVMALFSRTARAPESSFVTRADVDSPSYLVSYGQLDQSEIAINGTPSGSVVLWMEADGATAKIRMNASRVSADEHADTITIAEANIEETATFGAVRSAARGDDVLVVWQIFEGTHVVLRGAIVHMAGGEAQPVDLTSIDTNQLYAVLGFRDSFLVVMAAAQGMEAFRISAAGVADITPRLIPTTGYFLSADAAGDSALVLTSEETIALSPDGVVISSVRSRGGFPDIVAHGTNSFLRTDILAPAGLQRLNVNGFTTSSCSCLVASSESVTRMLSLRSGFLVMTRTIGLRVSETDPPVSGTPFTLPDGTVDAAAETPDRFALVTSHVTNAVALYVRHVDVIETARRRPVMSR